MATDRSSGPPTEAGADSFGRRVAAVAFVVVVAPLASTLGWLEYQRSLRAAYAAEAKDAVARMTRAATAAVEREHYCDRAREPAARPGGVVPASLRVGAAGGATPACLLADGDEAWDPANDHRMCGSATPVPSDLGEVRSKTYTPSTASGEDFDSGAYGTDGWRCLGFWLRDPLRYQYRYDAFTRTSRPVPEHPRATGPDAFEASAVGDLDGDGVTSRFLRRGWIEPKAWTVELAPAMVVERELE